jgi:rhodanese-related sulfurtransferase
MNQPTQNKEQINKGSTELKDKPPQEVQSNIQPVDKSCGDDTTSRPQSQQGQGKSSATKEEGCCSTDKEHANKTNVETISKDQLLAKIKNNDGVQIVNVLSPEHYGKGFIKGSKQIPLEQLDSRLGELDKTKEVVTYCASSECNASMKAAEKLAAIGFKVKAYEGGIKEWSEAGLPTDK